MAIRSRTQHGSSLIHERIWDVLIPPLELPVSFLQESVVLWWLLLGSDKVTIRRKTRHVRSERVSVRCQEGLSGGEVILTSVRAAQTRATHDTPSIPPGGLDRVCFLNRVPISNMLDRQHSTHVSVRLPPSVLSRELATSMDTLLVEIFGTLTPFDDGETLDGRTSAEQLTLLRGGLESFFNRLPELRQHVLR